MDNKYVCFPQDSTRVNVKEDYELRYWSERFGISQEKLREVVSEVGPLAGAIDEHLNGRYL